jgi:hypothetical protein
MDGSHDTIGTRHCVRVDNGNGEESNVKGSFWSGGGSPFKLQPWLWRRADHGTQSFEIPPWMSEGNRLGCLR